MSRVTRSIFVGALLVCVLPHMAHAQNVRAGTFGGANMAGSVAPSPQSGGAQNASNPPGNQNAGAAGNQTGALNTPPDNDNDLATPASSNRRSEAHGLSTTLIGVMLKQTSDALIAYMRIWENGPDMLAPQFMATDDEINTALNKVLNRPENPNPQH